MAVGRDVRSGNTARKFICLTLYNTFGFLRLDYENYPHLSLLKPFNVPNPAAGRSSAVQGPVIAPDIDSYQGTQSHFSLLARLSRSNL